MMHSPAEFGLTEHARRERQQMSTSADGAIRQGANGSIERRIRAVRLVVLADTWGAANAGRKEAGGKEWCLRIGLQERPFRLLGFSERAGWNPQMKGV